MPIIVFYCDGCREPLTDRKILDRVVELFARAFGRHLVRAHGGGTDARRARSAPSAAAREFSKENDILDVWFDSGSSHLAVLDDSDRAALAGGHVPGRRRSVSRLVPQFAAGRRRR